jgi:hypothetical protein
VAKETKELQARWVDFRARSNSLSRSAGLELHDLLLSGLCFPASAVLRTKRLCEIQSSRGTCPGRPNESLARQALCLS